MKKTTNILSARITKFLTALGWRKVNVRHLLPTGRQQCQYGMLIFAVCSVLLLVDVFPLSYAGDVTALANGNIYSDLSSPGLAENLKALLTNLILPNIPGALMLLIMSSFFSSINFYTIVQSRRRSFRVIARYLIAWILVNYLFALLFLLLILPNDLTLSKINKMLFVYCIVATAMPEIAANLKLQLGDSTNAINLYKYKTKVSELITERLGSCVAEQRCKELMALAFFYYGRLDHFLDKLAIFKNQEDLSSEEISDIQALAENLKKRHVDGEAIRVMELEREHHKVIPKLIQFFRDDIHRFAMSPVADLMTNIHPLLAIDEARKLVEAGVTNPRSFLWRCQFKTIRKRLAEATSIDENRLSTLFYSTRVSKRKRMFSRLRWVGAASAVLVVAFYVMSWIQMRSIPSFNPNNIIRSQLHIEPLSSNGSPSKVGIDPSAAPPYSTSTGLPK